jgi:hypothetical protein
MRWWLVGLPAGIGSATLRATLKLWLGFSPSRSGVFSAGNGPAMRSPVLGTAIDDIETLRKFVRASTRITHRAGIPKDWLDGLWEWPRSAVWMGRLAEAASNAVATGGPVRPPRVFPLLGLVRNAVFLGVVLAHVARRVLPPY